MSRLPKAVKATIETRLGAPMRHSHGTFAPHRCACGTWTLYGLNNTMTRLDPTPLTTTLEQAALILGRWTYELHGTPGHFEVTVRASPRGPIWHNPPPPGDDCVVVPTHSCGVPYLAPTIPITRDKNRKRITDTTPIPY